MSLRIDPEDSKTVVLFKLCYLLPAVPVLLSYYVIFRIGETLVEAWGLFRQEIKDIHDRLLRIED